MDSKEKADVIQKWVDPAERVTVDFLDEKDLNAEVKSVTPEHVDFAIETHFPHIKQDISIPLSAVELGEDRTKYTRDPDKPLQYGRLRIIINYNRPNWV